MKTHRRKLTGLSVALALATTKLVMAQQEPPAVQPTAPPAAAGQPEATGQLQTTDTELALTPGLAEPPRRVEPMGDVGSTQSSKLDHYMPAVRKAFELQISAGGANMYGGGVGEINGRSPNGAGITDPGGTVGLGFMARVSPRWAFGIYGWGSRLDHGTDVPNGTDIWAASAGLEADYHFRPSFSIDPFLTLATGGNYLWVSVPNVETTKVLGWEMARVTFGADFRLTRTFALAPMIGADAVLELSKNGPLENGFTNISPAKVNIHGFVGFQGRFDFGATAPAAPPTYAAGAEKDVF